MCLCLVLLIVCWFGSLAVGWFGGYFDVVVVCYGFGRFVWIGLLW